MDLDFTAALVQLATDLAAVDGVTTASVDPAKVRTPGVWVDFTGLQIDDTFAPSACTIQADLRLVVADVDEKRNQAELVKLLTAVLGVVDVVDGGVIRPVGVILQDGQSVLPGLSVPIALLNEE